MLVKIKGLLIVLLTLAAILSEVNAVKPQTKTQIEKLQKKVGRSQKSKKMRSVGVQTAVATAAQASKLLQKIKEEKAKIERHERCKRSSELYFNAAKRYKEEGLEGDGDLETLEYAVDHFKLAAGLFKEMLDFNREKQCYNESARLLKDMAKIAANCNENSKSRLEAWYCRGAAKCYSLVNDLRQAKDCYKKATIAFQELIKRLDGKFISDFTLKAFEECKNSSKM